MNMTLPQTIALTMSLVFYFGCTPPVITEPIPIEQCDAVAYPPVSPAIAPLVTDGHFFKDNDGRVVMLRGVNASGSGKVPDFMPLNDSSMFDPLPDWGVNILRLIFNWEAYEGTRCDFAESYMAYYEQAIEWAEERGIYVIVDFHQDAYSRYALNGCGEGFPVWAMSSAVTPAEPDNGPNCIGWGASMLLDTDNKLLWNHFHSNREGARDAYLDMLESVAHRLATHANIVGYDIINEPFGTKDQLKSLFEDATARIRAHHPQAIMFVPSPAIVSGGGTNNVEKPAISNFVYAPHYYDQAVYVFNAYLGNDVGIRLAELQQKAIDWEVPMFLGEFGAKPAVTNVQGYIGAVYDWLDAQFVSAAQWDYTPDWNPVDLGGWNAEDLSVVDDSGQLRENFIPRPYPQKTSGTPLNFALNEQGFTYQWDNVPAAGAAGTTEIFLPQNYSTDKVISVLSDSGSNADCTITAQLMSCQISDAGAVTVSLLAP